MDHDAISIPEEPVFVRQDQNSDTDSYSTRATSLSLADSISMAETKSFSSFGGTSTSKSMTGMEAIISDLGGNFSSRILYD